MSILLLNSVIGVTSIHQFEKTLYMLYMILLNQIVKKVLFFKHNMTFRLLNMKETQKMLIVNIYSVV